MTEHSCSHYQHHQGKQGNYLNREAFRWYRHRKWKADLRKKVGEEEGQSWWEYEAMVYFFAMFYHKFLSFSTCVFPG